MRPDFGADAVFERRNDLSARGVVFGVGAKDQSHIEIQAHRIALNLHIAFLHDVEERYLDLARQVRQFIDGKDSTIGPRQ